MQREPSASARACTAGRRPRPAAAFVETGSEPPRLLGHRLQAFECPQNHARALGHEVEESETGRKEACSVLALARLGSEEQRLSWDWGLSIRLASIHACAAQAAASRPGRAGDAASPPRRGRGCFAEPGTAGVHQMDNARQFTLWVRLARRLPPSRAVLQQPRLNLSALPAAVHRIARRESGVVLPY